MEPEEGLDLPDWSQGLLIEQSGISCSPVKQPLAQVTLKDGNTQRVTALGRPGAAAPKPSLPPMPAPALPPPSLQPTTSDAENEAEAGPSQPEAPRSAPRLTHTPSRTGLTARPVRMPSRLGQTPGAAKQQQGDAFVVPPSAKATVPAGKVAGGGGNLKSILKRLNFSATKGRAAAAAAPAPGHASAAAASTAPPATQQRQPVSAAAAAQSTIKQLRFNAGATPAAATAAKPGGATAGRHVTFDAATVSPAARSRPAAASGQAWRTPEPTIREEDSGGSCEEEGGSGGVATPLGAGASSVNSERAGHTPYDRRLSSLFHKYQVAGTPELPDSELEALVEGGAVSSPSWHRLSSASVPESIRELAKKYTSDAEEGGSTPAGATPAGKGMPALPEGAEAEAEAATPVQAGAAGEGRSPTLDPTPHHVLDSMMKKNALYESPSGGEAAAGSAPAAAAEQAAGGGQQAAEAAAAPGQLSPASAVASLLGPLLRITLDEINASKAGEAGQQEEQPGASAAPQASQPAAPSSPAEFYGFPSLGSAATPNACPSPCVDGVPRTSDGIPAITPATVTVRRGSSGSQLGLVLEDDALDLAADLFRSTFSPGDSFGGSPGAGGEVGEVGPAEQQQHAPSAVAAADGSTPLAAPASAAAPGSSPEFSFFPAGAPGPSNSARAAAAGVTPELPAGNGAAAQLGSTVSPEILGFYEQQASQQQQQQASTEAGEEAGPSQAQHAHGPAMPRSIIKSGRLLNEAGTPVLGRAQRGGAADGPAPPTITRELQALMADLRLDDASEIKQMGTVSALSPVRTTGALRGLLGGLARAITPVRRSARKPADSKPLEAMLEETGYSYVPNSALMPEDAQPKLEAAEAKAARKAASQAPAEPSLMQSLAEAGQPEVSSTPQTAGRRYGTRSAAREEQQGGESEQGGGQASGAAAAATPAPEQPSVEASAVSGRRLSLRRLRTPRQQVQGTPGGASTPVAAAADLPVAQDASPQLAESPSFGGALGAANAATPPASRLYSFRSSTLKKSKPQQATSGGTPLPAAASAGTPAGGTPAAPGMAGGKAATPPQLSPTEQGIRASLRRSARKSSKTPR